jgi:hypothetical protein
MLQVPFLIFCLLLAVERAVASPAEVNDYSHAPVYWREVKRSRINDCQVLDRFKVPALQERLCIARVDREILCADKISTSRISLDFVATPRLGCGCKNLSPNRDFLDINIVRSWEDLPVILDSASRLLERLPREFRRHELTAEEANALGDAGFSALQEISFDIGETFGPDTLSLTFVVDECNCTIVLLMDKNRPEKHAWALLVE